MVSINTNLSSLVAQRSLRNSTSKLNNAIEQMTTGYKINHAKDNAANYSIAVDMSTKIGAYEVAEENCAMALDMVTTAIENLDIIADKFTRMRALTEQYMNGTYGEDSILAIAEENYALKEEVERIFKSTEFNGRTLFYIPRSESDPILGPGGLVIPVLPTANDLGEGTKTINFQIGVNGDSNSQISIELGMRFSNFWQQSHIIGDPHPEIREIFSLADIDKFLSVTTTTQTKYGAFQNRLESALEAISTQYENLVSSRSTLRDSDVAEVSSEYIKQQILQQASATLLSTANQSPAIALQLI